MRPAPKKRALPSAALELAMHAAGVDTLAGLDEAGRGSWAGPVVAAAVILPLNTPEDLRKLNGVRDSKLMTPRQREEWARTLKHLSVAYAIGQASSKEIDQLGILPATRLAMMRACQGLSPPPEHLLIDYMLLPELSCPQTALSHGDALVVSIAAASILAKVTRDHMMIALDDQYPEFGFARHKGYGTQLHRKCLKQYGPCTIHRFSYAPVQAADQIAGQQPL